MKQSTTQDGSYSVITAKELDNDTNPVTYTARQGSGTVGCLSKEGSAVFVDDNIFVSSGGLEAVSREMNLSSERSIEHRSTYVDPRLRREDLSKAVCGQYGTRLYVLCTASGHVYAADAYLAENPGAISPWREYNWAYLEGWGVYLDGSGNIADTGGTFWPAACIGSLGDGELYIGCRGHVCKVNFDLPSTARASELTPAAYTMNGRAIGDRYLTPYDWFGRPNYQKRLMPSHNALVLRTRISARVNVTWRTDETTLEKSKVLYIKPQGVSYAYRDYSRASYGALPDAVYALKKMTPRDFMRLQVKVESAAAGVCTAVDTMTLEAEILDTDLK